MFEQFKFGFKPVDDSVRNFVAVNKQTKEELVLGKLKQDVEWYGPTGSRINTKTRKVFHFTWNKEGLSKLAGREVKVASSQRMANMLGGTYDFIHATGMRGAPTVAGLTQQVEEALGNKTITESKEIKALIKLLEKYTGKKVELKKK